MNKSESDPPSGEEEEEILLSSSDSESGTKIVFDRPEEKANWDWYHGLSEEEADNYNKARKACFETEKSFPLVALYNRTKEALAAETKTYEVRKELIAIKESLLKGQRDIEESLKQLTELAEKAQHITNLR